MWYIIIIVVAIAIAVVLFLIRPKSSSNIVNITRVAGAGVKPDIKKSCHKKHQIVAMMNNEHFKFLSQIFDFNTQYPQVLFGKCQLSNRQVYKFIKKELEAKIVSIFQKYVTQIDGVQISPYNLFHCHVIAAGQAEKLVLLFHAFEYPADGGSNLGYCQVGSNVSMHAKNFKKRNVLYDMTTDEFKILTCNDVYCTRYAEEFGTELGEIICVKQNEELQLFFDKF